MPSRSQTNNQAGQLAFRLILITPYSPFTTHDHAADDLAHHVIRELGRKVDLHVIAPFGTRATTEVKDGITYHHLANRREFHGARFFGIYPSFARKDWSRRQTREARRLVKRLGADHVHIEYLQPVEVALRGHGRWSVTLHDVTETVFAEYLRRSGWPRKAYRIAEFIRVRRLERLAASRAEVVFCLSEADAGHFSVRCKRSVALKLGVPRSEHSWAPSTRDAPLFVFAGALWRSANVAAASYLAKEIMPLVRQKEPNARLRVVGARPAQALVDLQGKNGVEIVGRVDSIDYEYSKASAVFAPTLVGAGVLLKALRALDCGAPLILNSVAAAPLNIRNGVHALVADSPEEFAAAALLLANNPELSQELSEAAKGHVRDQFSWGKYAETMIEEICR